MTSSRLRSPGQLLLHLALAAVVVWGSFVRVDQLWVGDLTLEELNHYYVGRALVEQHQAVLPSGVGYGRALEYSRLTEWTNRFIASPEIAVRLPSAVFGSLTVVVLAAGTYALAGPVGALSATLLFAAYPEAIIQARTGRMYSVQLLAGLIALFTGWLVVRGPPSRSRRELVRGWAAALATLAALLVATRMQETTLPTVLAWWLFLAGVGYLDVRSSGPEAWRRSVPLQVALAMASLAALVFVAVPTVVIPLTLRAVSTPYWARTTEYSPLLYYQSLAIWYPAVAVVGAASFAYLLLRRRRLGAYLLTLSMVPATIFSVLPFRAPRFMLLAVPPLWVAIGAALALAAERLTASEPAGRPTATPRPRWVRSLTMAVLLLLPAITAGPALVIAAMGYHRIETPSWTAAAAILGGRSDLAGIPRGATRSLPATFYWGHVDFSVSVGHLEQWGTAQGGAESDLLSGAYMMSVAGTPDMYAGVPVLPKPDDVIAHFKDVRAVVIGIDDSSLGNLMVDPALLRTLEVEAEELCNGSCGSLRLFLWRLPAGADLPSASRDPAPER